MTLTEASEKLLRSFKRYYNVKQEEVDPPFYAEAEFSLHDEQYFLVRSAKLSEADSKEFVFFSAEEHLTEERLRELDETAWERGLSRVRPHANHRNSDVILFVLADQIDDGALALVKKLHHYKSYRYSLQGWSHYKLAVLEISTGRMAFNRQGRSFKKLVSNIL